jgi:hypothetical protein
METFGVFLCMKGGPNGSIGGRPRQYASNVPQEKIGCDLVNRSSFVFGVDCSVLIAKARNFKRESYHGEICDQVLRAFITRIEEFRGAKGYCWGGGFSGSSVDSMHFELSKETIEREIHP